MWLKILFLSLGVAAILFSGLVCLGLYGVHKAFGNVPPMLSDKRARAEWINKNCTR
jgi:hypothetical protein